MTKLEPFYRRTCGYVGRGIQFPCPKCNRSSWGIGPDCCKWQEIRPEDDIRALMQQTLDSIGFLRKRLEKAEAQVQKAEQGIVLNTRLLLHSPSMVLSGMYRLRLDDAHKRLETWTLRRDKLLRRLREIDSKEGEDGLETTTQTPIELDNSTAGDSTD